MAKGVSVKVDLGTFKLLEEINRVSDVPKSKIVGRAVKLLAERMDIGM